MFDFSRYEQKEQEILKTSHGRFKHRIQKWKDYGHETSQTAEVAKHHFWWFVHNCIAHPLIGLFPIKKTFEFHDYTSRRINVPENK